MVVTIIQNILNVDNNQLIILPKKIRHKQQLCCMIKFHRTISVTMDYCLFNRKKVITNTPSSHMQTEWLLGGNGSYKHAAAHNSRHQKLDDFHVFLTLE